MVAASHGEGCSIGRGRRVVAVRPPRPLFHSAEVLPEFVVWSENSVSTWLQLLCSFAGELSALGTSRLWLQADGCCSRASWVGAEVAATGSMVLTLGWQAFARA